MDSEESFHPLRNDSQMVLLAFNFRKPATPSGLENCSLKHKGIGMLG